MIFNLYSRVAVKLGDERYEFDRKSLMFTEVIAIEDATGLAFSEWQWELGRGSIRATAGLLHILRKRAGVPSDFETLDFAADDLEVVPLHEDGTEFTRAEVAEDVARRIAEAKDPTAAAEPAAIGEDQPAETTAPTSLTSQSGTTSDLGNGNSSPGQTSTSSGETPTSG